MYYLLKKTDSGIEIILMTIFNKSERSTIKKEQAIKLLKEILVEHDREMKNDSR
jgi:hypothetical protein